jgi:hypothetical protein
MAAVAPFTLWVTRRGLLNYNKHGDSPVFRSGQLLFWVQVHSRFRPATSRDIPALHYGHCIGAPVASQEL